MFAGFYLIKIVTTKNGGGKTTELGDNLNKFQLNKKLADSQIQTPDPKITKTYQNHKTEEGYHTIVTESNTWITWLWGKSKNK